MEILRENNLQYLSQYMDMTDAQKVEEYVFKQTENENQYKRKARLFLAALQRKSWSYNEAQMAQMIAPDLHAKRWAPFHNAERFVETTTAEQMKPVATSMYTCGKCKKNECTFYTQQLRSGDEGETVFITCLNCGHKWKQG